MLVVRTPQGLYCPPGDFFIDPHQAVRRAIITHAHTDHCRPGMGSYLTSVTGEPIVRARVGLKPVIETLPFGEAITLGQTTVSLHPAGHILGSAQVRIEHAGEVWVVSGDYKLEADATCEAFEHLECDTFITESTFAHPKYAWKPQKDVFNRINDWWQLNNAWGRTTIIYAYSLGKAQRILAGVDDIIGPIYVHEKVDRFNQAYKKANIKLPPHKVITDETIDEIKGLGALIVTPPQLQRSAHLLKVGEYETAFASGWMASKSSFRSMLYDHGFALSDHADWNGLIEAVRRSKAKRVIVMHGFTENLASYLRRQGLDAFAWK